MKTVATEIRFLIQDRERAFDRMQEEFDRADNNPFVQSGVAKSISDLGKSIEELKRFLQIAEHKELI